MSNITKIKFMQLSIPLGIYFSSSLFLQPILNSQKLIFTKVSMNLCGSGLHHEIINGLLFDAMDRLSLMSYSDFILENWMKQAWKGSQGWRKIIFFLLCKPVRETLLLYFVSRKYSCKLVKKEESKNIKFFSFLVLDFNL